MPKYAVVAIIDDFGTEKIISLQKALGRTQDYSAHITIGVYNNISGNLLLPWVKNMVQSHYTIPFWYGAVGMMYRRNIYAAPCTTQDLMQMYIDFHQQYDDLCVDYNSMKNNQWFQHTSIHHSFDIDTAKKMLSLAIDLFEPFPTRIVGIKVTEILEQDYKQIYIGYLQ